MSGPQRVSEFVESCLYDRQEPLDGNDCDRARLVQQTHAQIAAVKGVTNGMPRLWQGGNQEFESLGPTRQKCSSTVAAAGLRVVPAGMPIATCTLRYCSRLSACSLVVTTAQLAGAGAVSVVRRVAMVSRKGVPALGLRPRPRLR